MKNKFKFLTKESLKRKTGSKWFKIVNIILCLVIIAALNIDNIIKLFGGDFQEKNTVYIIDNVDGNVYDVFTSQINTSTSMFLAEDNNYIVEKYDKTLEDAKEEVKKSGKIIVLEFNKDSENVINVTFLSKEYKDLKDMAILNTAINNTKVSYAMIEYNVNPESLAKIYENVKINRIFIDEEKDDKSENTNMLMTTVFPVVILPFFMLTIILVQMIGAEVNDEKTTKSMEIIISNVSPETHLASKVAAGNLFILIQGGLLIAFVGLGILVRLLSGSGLASSGTVGNYIGTLIDMFKGTEIMSQLAYILPLLLVLLVITFLAYSLLAGILAAMTTNTEDFQQLQTPIVMISLIGYYLAILAGLFKGSILIRILSYIPFISAILSPSLLVLGEIGIIDVLIAIAISVLLVFWMIKYGIRIYKVGILNYSSKDLWKKMFKSLKQKKV